ncbi:type II toxin-antitoxin system ParD family antitoxin [Pseudanabaena sp. FACHB-1277]|jgi:antitoxin ParD1/3/4|uniref:Type II toxin-antitoxin system ParD family antitoxin n=1 Tax=Pseudanabaena cinerea FACHB-1277 TaxID=2949581 RepID=A0A926USE4_9CYAN|nr:type II toxin-antitoxin system ParD family antitoxin [Pseudanabaena cinerea]MBD2150239.1 type II toxin-antitoxin system ParD family antitoxin [Pseudanabaena cinerea FACHB-1277]
MNVSVPIPQELETYIQLQIQSGGYNTVADYFLALLNQDRQKKEAQAKLANLLQEGLNSDPKIVTPDYWQNLRLSFLGSD